MEKVDDKEKVESARCAESLGVIFRSGIVRR